MVFIEIKTIACTVNKPVVLENAGGKILRSNQIVSKGYYVQLVIMHLPFGYQRNTIKYALLLVSSRKNWLHNKLAESEVIISYSHLRTHSFGK